MLLNFDYIKIAKVSDYTFFKVFYKGCCHCEHSDHKTYKWVILNAYITT